MSTSCSTSHGCKSEERPPSSKRGDIVNYLRECRKLSVICGEKADTAELPKRCARPRNGLCALYIDKVVSNLISNAIKHTREEDIDFRIDTSQNRPMLLCVSDTGVGIDPEDLPRIFELFYHNEQLDRRHGNRHRSPSHACWWKMNGKIEVKHSAKAPLSLYACLSTTETKHPSGSKRRTSRHSSALFSASAIATANTERTDEYGTEIKPAANANPNAPLLLIVEDNADVRLYLQTLLSPYYQMLTAADGEEDWPWPLSICPTDSDRHYDARKDGIALCTELETRCVNQSYPCHHAYRQSTDEDRIARTTLRCGLIYVNLFKRKSSLSPSIICLQPGVFCKRNIPG